MCDTVCSLPSNNDNKSLSYFAKNSDREPNEAQIVEYYPRTERRGSLKATHISVEYNGVTNAIIISRPEWMWGAEMGFNENGVSIGNEAIFTKGNRSLKALLGMDLLRLGLEKGESANGAANAIIDYLEQYGQGGTNSKDSDYFYDNSFIISDHSDAYILETEGKEWRKTRIAQSGSISNTISDDVIFSERDETKGFSPSHNTVITMMGKGAERQRQTRDALTRVKGNASLESLMEMMRSHRKIPYAPSIGSNEDICMHAGSMIRRNQSVNSMITETGKDFTIGWFTFSSNPCISLYKPIIFQGDFIGSTGYDRSYWISTERVHRKMLSFPVEDYSESVKSISAMQKRVNDLVSPIRSRLLAGKKISEYDADSLYHEVREADRIVLSGQRRKVEQINSRAPFSFRRWWEKTNAGLTR